MARASVSASPPGFQETACPKCGSWNQHPLLTGRDHLHELPGEFTACECDACGLWFLNPQPTPEHISELYPADYAPHDEPDPRPIGADVASYLAEELGYTHLTAARPARSWRARIDRSRQRWKACVELVPQFVPGGSVLEIGAASGARLAALRNLGWTDLHGIELVASAAERARARGAKIACGSVEDMLVTYPDASFDVVIMSMVLEHLANPFEVMARIATKLRPGGQLLFSTITRDGLDARLYGPYWGGFDFPRHLVFLRDRDIADMLGAHFETHERAHHAAPQDFVRSAEWRRHEARWLDRLVLAVHDPLLRYRLGLVLAWARLTSRVSYRCRRLHTSR